MIIAIPSPSLSLRDLTDGNENIREELTDILQTNDCDPSHMYQHHELVDIVAGISQKTGDFSASLKLQGESRGAGVG